MREARKRIRGNPSGVRVPNLPKSPNRPPCRERQKKVSGCSLGRSCREWPARERLSVPIPTRTATWPSSRMSVRREELNTSKRLLESHLNSPVQSFAYPYGRKAQMSAAARENIIRAGYNSALSAENGLATGASDLFSLPRLGYERPIWRFTGEILYQFVKQAWRDRRNRSSYIEPWGSSLSSSCRLDKRLNHPILLILSHQVIQR